MKRKKISLAIFIVGIVALIGGVTSLAIKLNEGPELQDGEYLVTAGDWVLEPSVIWDFTEIGKGTLTTNGHINDYDFIWALENGKLIIETDWLYILNDTYDYALDKSAGTLTLTSEDEEIVFRAVPRESAE